MATLRPSLATEIEASLRRSPIGRARLYEQVATHIEGLIVSGRLRTGDKLPSERDLMGLFAVGRTAIREAIFELQRKGVVTTQNGARPVVALPTPEVIFSTLSGSVRLYVATEPGMRDFQYARRILEGSVARQAALNAADGTRGGRLSARSATTRPSGVSRSGQIHQDRCRVPSCHRGAQRQHHDRRHFIARSMRG